MIEVLNHNKRIRLEHLYLNDLTIDSSFPRLFYLSASNDVLYVDENESQFNTFEVNHVGIS